MRKSVIFLFVILLVPGVFALQADFAIYTGSGTWEPSITAFENFLEWKGLTWQEIGKNDINKKKLIGNYRGLFMPGGWAGNYNQAINLAGDQHIRDFISGGGAYIGMSAGAFYACDITIWEGDVLDYPSNMFDGDCIGPIEEIAPWPEYVITTMNIEQSHPANVYEPAQRDVLYYGEPYFVAHPGQEMQVFARWIVPSNPSLDNTPGIIGFNYGSGRILLVGPHPEIEEDDTRDGTDFAEELSDGPDGSDWPFIWTGVDWILQDPISQPPGTQLKQCNDGIDNDGDSLTDFPDDPGCDDSNDDDETDPLPACSDGIDNDGDGLIDSADLGCLDANDNDERDSSLICDDGIDNDGDTLTDLNDPGCIDQLDSSELGVVQCDDGIDNDGDSFVDFPSDIGCTDSLDNDEINTGPVEVFFDGFENGMGNWALYGSGRQWASNSESFYEGGLAARAKRTGAGDDSFMETSFDVSQFSTVTFEYFRRLKGLDAADDFEVQYFNGLSWVSVEHLGSSSENNADFIFKSFNIPNSASKVRFKCECGAVSEKCFVDNVRILGE
jgi:glutamine amidotransferase-like uncharacterized protein